MSTYNKVKGSRWETDLESFFNEQGFKARRLPRNGSKDIGDVAIEVPFGVIVVEAKNVKDTWGQMLQFLREADVEADNYTGKYGDDAYPVVATKTRSRGVGEGRIVMTMNQFVDLLRAFNG